MISPASAEGLSCCGTGQDDIRDLLVTGPGPHPAVQVREDKSVEVRSEGILQTLELQGQGFGVMT